MFSQGQKMLAEGQTRISVLTAAEIFGVHMYFSDTDCTGMSMKVQNMQNKNQVPQEKPLNA